jgi:glycosyltransferase involved in cell wall biosynthesis
MIKVAIIQSKLNSGGVKNVVMEYYRHIDRSNFQFDYLCDKGSNSIPYEEFERLGGKIYTVTPYKHIVRHIYDVWKILKENKYEIIHGFDNLMNVFALAPAKFCGTKVRIAENLSTGHKGETQSLIKFFLKPFATSFANYYMANGTDVGLWTFGKKKMNAGEVAIFKTIVNAQFNEFNFELRETTREKFGWNDNVVYGFIGRLAPQKNPLFLVDILKSIIAKQKNAKLAVIGWGKLEQPLLEKIKIEGLKNFVDFLGRREDIQQFYNAFDAFLLPSLYEGLPVVGLESQACGLPVFFSDEITKEASVCELGNFIPLKNNANYWANQIIEKTAANIPIRRSHSKEIAEKGYDSTRETVRLQKYYFKALKEQGVIV